MGSETGAKWFMIILMYFALMTFIVALISDVSDINLGTGGEQNQSGTYCSLPRTTHEVWITGEGERTIRITDTMSGEGRTTNFWQGNIECKYSAGQLSNETCLAISGCSWEQQTLFWFPIGDYSCRGKMNYTWINQSEVVSVLNLGDVIIYGDDNYDICSYPEVINDEDRCRILSCDWGDQKRELSQFSEDDIDLTPGMVNKIWKVSKDMVTFRFDFGFDNATANGILYFLVFGLPLIGLALSLYVMVRS